MISIKYKVTKIIVLEMSIIMKLATLITIIPYDNEGIVITMIISIVI